ncbi:MAG: response regulator [Candidatus Latescibacteria bacterium]|nr:response regulator [Candidatus Latescibacterota bacterium]
MATRDLDLTGSKILLVDDTPENLKILRETLETEGYSILVATSGEAALKIAAGGRPDLVLLDVMMPGIDGFETCRRLKRDDITRDTPVLFVTARGETESVLEGFAVGGVDYIVKPFQSQEVLMRVRTHLQIDRLSRDLARSNAELTRTNEDLQDEIARRKALGVERDHLAEHLSLISSREAEQFGLAGIVGETRTLRETLDAVGRLQGSEATVLILGESGTGKELVARAIHHGSQRASSSPWGRPARPGSMSASSRPRTPTCRPRCPRGPFARISTTASLGFPSSYPRCASAGKTSPCSRDTSSA